MLHHSKTAQALFAIPFVAGSTACGVLAGVIAEGDPLLWGACTALATALMIGWDIVRS